MKKKPVIIQGIEFPVYSVNTLIIGSGAASLNAAVQCRYRGITDLLIVTEKWGGGTSNNTGSDKQTYYKLSLCGNEPDSPADMARDLAAGGCMHGDIALCEAQNSAACFFHLVQLGVPFPHDRYGGYVGYKTDHDPRQRATSAGPLTSHYMFQALARQVQTLKIPFLEQPVIALLTRKQGRETHIAGAVGLDTRRSSADTHGLVLYNARNVIMGTGGPAGLWASSVYPESQTGSSGLALSVGAAAQNLTETQFGIASIQFRWNLSGSYQQVIPRYISTASDGSDEREFLNEIFPDAGTLCTAIFLKGYQWPFDANKIVHFGSSLIDLLVYRETMHRKRRVFLDYTRNPEYGTGKPRAFRFEDLAPEALQFLQKRKLCFGTPFQRLQTLNEPAVNLYKRHGIDLSRDPLEIAVCAQHNNGGLTANNWWESNIRHLFPVGEVNGSHGVYRPGGSALNAGQVGGLRAACYIATRYGDPPPQPDRFLQDTKDQILKLLKWTRNRLDRQDPKVKDIDQHLRLLRERMSKEAGILRNPARIKEAVREAWSQLDEIDSSLAVSHYEELSGAFKLGDLCLTHAVYLEAVQAYLKKGGGSRGSCLIMSSRGAMPAPGLEKDWRFSVGSPKDWVSSHICELRMKARRVWVRWVKTRPVPRETACFETVWKAFRENRIPSSTGRL
ncbi:MAG TPA: FAD-binding protein [bacterium]|nr:FAD-binding protein [bacterium]